jgi:hypothetical protein
MTAGMNSSSCQWQLTTSRQVAFFIKEFFQSCQRSWTRSATVSQCEEF